VRRFQRALDEHNQTAAIPISVSVGARTVDPASPEEILSQADKAMYAVKAKGKADPQGDIEGQLRSWLEDSKD
jgi:GGDEF domain-containing protein